MNRLERFYWTHQWSARWFCRIGAHSFNFCDPGCCGYNAKGQVRQYCVACGKERKPTWREFPRPRNPWRLDSPDNTERAAALFFETWMDIMLAPIPRRWWEFWRR